MIYMPKEKTIKKEEKNESKNKLRKTIDKNDEEQLD